MALETDTTQEPTAAAMWAEEALKRADDTPPPDSAASNTFTEELKDTEQTQATAGESTESAPEKPADDPLASLPEPVRQRLAKFDELEAKLQAQADAFALRENDFKAAAGRISAIQSELDAAKATQKLAPKDSPTQAQIDAAAKSPEKWEQMKGDFPSWGEAIEDYVQAKLGALPQPKEPTPGIDQSAVDTLVNERVSASQQHMAKQLEDFRVQIKYPEWKTTVNTSDFKAWMTAQDAEIKALANSPRGIDAIALIDKFELAKAKPVTEVKQERSQRLQAAATTRPGVSTPPKKEEDMSPAELWNYMAKTRERQAA